MNYDYLIVGAGLFGCTFAHEMTKAGKRCLVIDRRSHIAGNAFTEEINGVMVHKYGAHIFHTSDDRVWNFVNSFVNFNHFVNSPIAVYGDERYHLPFNMNTFHEMWGVETKEEAEKRIQEQTAVYKGKEVKNLEEQALSMVGPDIYVKLIKGYTEKQWGRNCKDLPSFIIKRLPLRFTYDNNYFNDPNQGIPNEGYTALAEKLLEGSELLLNTDYRSWIKDHKAEAKKTIYTGMIDEFFDYQLGHLAYRSLKFETETLPMADYQGNAVINYTKREVPYTRVIEHKHFVFGQQENTVISKEYPMEWDPSKEPYYPVNDQRNQELFMAYKKLSQKCPDVIFGGRLGLYKYYDMDQVIKAALTLADQERETLSE